MKFFPIKNNHNHCQPYCPDLTRKAKSEWRESNIWTKILCLSNAAFTFLQRKHPINVILSELHQSRNFVSVTIQLNKWQRSQLPSVIIFMKEIEPSLVEWCRTIIGIHPLSHLHKIKSFGLTSLSGVLELTSYEMFDEYQIYQHTPREYQSRSESSWF